MKPYRIGIAMERESIFARSVLEGLAAAQKDFANRGIVFDMRFLHDRLVRDGSDISKFDAFVAQVQDDEMAERLSANGRPVVDVLFKKHHPGCAVVNVDNAAIARLAAAHLLERRFEHFAFFGRNGVSYSDERAAVFAEAIGERGGSVIEYVVPAAKQKAFFQGPLPTMEEAVENPLDAKYLRNWVRSLPRGTAVFCCQDLRAYQLMHECYEAGRAIPEDIAILGVDDDPIFCSFSDPRLSSVDPDAQAVGANALSLLASSLIDGTPTDSAHSVFVPPKTLTVRESTEVFHYEPSWLGEAMVYIHRDPSVNLTASMVFEHVGKSHTLVERMFRQVLGTTVQKEIMRVRLVEAERLLRTTDLPVNEVAKRSGFVTFSYFCSAFASTYGQSAAAYRESARKRE